MVSPSGVVVLQRSEVQQLLTMDKVLEAVERCFKHKAKGEAIMPPKIYLDIARYGGDFRAMPAYVGGYAGVKWVSVYPNNSRRKMPAVMAVIIISDPETGQPLAVMDGGYITSMRTGAAGGIAVKYLARKNSRIIGMVGAGVQAKTQLMAMAQVLPWIDEVKVFDLSGEASRAFVMDMTAKLGVRLRVVQSIEEVTEADVVVTTTPSTRPVVMNRHIKPGTHINAIGADAPGKQELEPGILLRGKIVVDDVEQASHSGEINVPLSQGVIKVDDIYGTLGDIVVGKKRGRESDEEITIFDSTGLAIEDVICAGLAYEESKGLRTTTVNMH
jgi:alanine dehydrogenase